MAGVLSFGLFFSLIIREAYRPGLLQCRTWPTIVQIDVSGLIIVKEAGNFGDRERERVESTLIASVFSASKSPRAILRSISSMIAVLLRPLTNTLFFVPEMFSQGISGDNG